MEFKPEIKEYIQKKIISRYPDKTAALLPVLHIAQKEFGFISPEVEKYVADYLSLPVMHVEGVATFYTMYNKKPVGKYHVQVCTNISCMILDAEPLLEYIGKKLNIKSGETTADGKFTLNAVECLGSCGTAPMMQINDDYYENLTPQKIDEILDKLAKA